MKATYEKTMRAIAQREKELAVRTGLNASQRATAKINARRKSRLSK